MSIMPGAPTRPQPCVRSPFFEIVMEKPPDTDRASPNLPAPDEMSKRKRDSNGMNGQEIAGPKRSNSGPSITSPSMSHGGVDPTYGQRSAFPGLDDDDANGNLGDSDLECEEATDALRYLQGVRREAKGIPTLLVAPKNSHVKIGEVDRSMYNDGIGDTRGWYRDGAYTAAPEQVPSLSSGASSIEAPEPTPQTVYYKLLIERFKLLRENLKVPPPSDVVENLDADHGFHMCLSRKDYMVWRWRLQNTDPIMVQLAAMDKATVLRLLRLILKKSFLRKCKDPAGAVAMLRTSAWIWGLLARLPDRGEMLSEEVGLVRELGKEAVWVGMQVKGMSVENLVWDGDEDEGNEEEDVVDVELEFMEEEPDTGGVDMEDGEASRIEKHDSPMAVETEQRSNGESMGADDLQDLTAAKERLLAHLNDHGAESEPSAEKAPDQEDEDVTFVREQKTNREESTGNEDHAKALLNTRATIDMIITVAGETYGQRDLLEFRHLWAEEGDSLQAK